VRGLGPTRLQPGQAGRCTLAHVVFEQLDYIYEPSADVATDIVYLEKVMGAG
jgi:hypothetical protein